MTQEEWLGDYFGTPFDELQSTIRAYNPSFSTSLGPVDESLYRSWKNQNAPGDTGDTYDYRGAYQAGVTPEQPPLSGHWTDRFKTPSHPTFSVESQYAGAYPERAGSWDGDTYMPPAPPQATPSELPSPPYSSPPPGKFPTEFPTALMEYAKNRVPHSLEDLRTIGGAYMMDEPEQARIMSAVQHPIETIATPVKEFMEATGQDKWNKGVALGMDMLGAARTASFAAEWTPPWHARKRPIPTGELRPSVGPRTPGYVPSPPPSGNTYLEAFRNAVSKDDEVGAINILRNAGKQDVSIPFRPDDYFNNRSFYVMKELDKYTLQTKGYSPFDVIFRRPPE